MSKSNTVATKTATLSTHQEGLRMMFGCNSVSEVMAKTFSNTLGESMPKFKETHKVSKALKIVEEKTFTFDEKDERNPVIQASVIAALKLHYKKASEAKFAVLEKDIDKMVDFLDNRFTSAEVRKIMRSVLKRINKLDSDIQFKIKDTPDFNKAMHTARYLPNFLVTKDSIVKKLISFFDDMEAKAKARIKAAKAEEKAAVKATAKKAVKKETTVAEQAPAQKTLSLKRKAAPAKVKVNFEEVAETLVAEVNNMQANCAVAKEDDIIVSLNNPMVEKLTASVPAAVMDFAAPAVDTVNNTINIRFLMELLEANDLMNPKFVSTFASNAVTGQEDPTELKAITAITAVLANYDSWAAIYEDLIVAVKIFSNHTINFIELSKLGVNKSSVSEYINMVKELSAVVPMFNAFWIFLNELTVTASPKSYQPRIYRLSTLLKK